MIKTIAEIPSTFMLGGEKITVLWSDTLHTEMDCWGMAEYRTNSITLQTQAGNERNEDAIVQTFLHEVFHFILHRIGQDSLHCDEMFVDLLATFAHQFWMSSK